jgi:hypothetical protein
MSLTDQHLPFGSEGASWRRREARPESLPADLLRDRNFTACLSRLGALERGKWRPRFDLGQSRARKFATDFHA